MLGWGRRGQHGMVGSANLHENAWGSTVPAQVERRNRHLRGEGLSNEAALCQMPPQSSMVSETSTASE